jgi:hypothetical protein
MEPVILQLQPQPQQRYLRETPALRSEEGPGLSPYGVGFAVVVSTLLVLLILTLLFIRHKTINYCSCSYALPQEEDGDDLSLMDTDFNVTCRKHGGGADRNDADYVTKTMQRASSFVKQCLGGRQYSLASRHQLGHKSIDQDTATMMDDWTEAETLEEILSQQEDEEQSSNHPSSIDEESISTTHEPSPEAQRQVQEEVEKWEEAASGTKLDRAAAANEESVDEFPEITEIYNELESFFQDVQEMFTPEEVPQPRKLVLPPPPEDDSPIPAFETSLLSDEVEVEQSQDKVPAVLTSDTKPDPEAPHIYGPGEF